MTIINDPELPLSYVKISGPAVDAFENRKECGSPVEITEAELRRNLERSKAGILRGLKMLIEAPSRTR